ASVRIPCKWSDYLEKNDEDGDGTNYELMEINGYSRLDRVKEILGWIRNAGMRAVLNVHHYNEMMDVAGTGLTLEEHQDRLNALWDQLSTEFPLSEYPADELVFELLNEPHSDMNYAEWNTVITMLAETIWTDNA
ncbi:MAG: glycoside hydrolase family 5 protein, partial [Gammaproteobacteria bacterium]|nr:glycoside hydrolase family 5 protein [Gammaproteobacteria bacterium]NIR95122.1 glycoside hydrolase family 5 protein [Gammaproteobacteria bacterium]NIW47099.1 cellulase family glycosylhydrolase [Gammaproteobacteria bacterium]NIX55903.1 cellulase family glycosylhydrolase [candidate division Zixibacteria bacterium]